RPLPNLLIVPILILVACGTSATPINYDAGLYHLQVLKYLLKGALPFGLANIHGRFGFNNALYAVGATLRGPVFLSDGVFLISAVIFLHVSGGILHRLWFSWGKPSHLIANFFATFVIGVWIWNLNGLLFQWFSLGPNADVPCAILI